MSEVKETGGSRGVRTVTVRGREFDVDDAYASSWAALALFREFRRPGLDTMAKLDLSFKLIELATGLDEEAVVELAGGPMAPASDVIGFAAEVVAAIVPKN